MRSGICLVRRVLLWLLWLLMLFALFAFLALLFLYKRCRLRKAFRLVPNITLLSQFGIVLLDMCPLNK